MNEISQKKLILGRRMYMLEAMLEYLISILVAGSFLATITKELKFSDSLTGILSSIISLGCLFQLISMFIRKNKFKKFVITNSILNQLLFLILYIIPLLTGAKTFKTFAFVFAIISAYLIYNIAHPKKINWLMSLVEDNHRGIFTANKEIISLVCGMVFSFLMGAAVDYFVDKGEIRIAFIITAAVMLVISVLHTLTMLFTPEKTNEIKEKKNIGKIIKSVVGNKKLIMVTVVFILYNVVTYSTTPFYGTYFIKELGFSLKETTLLATIGSVSRVLVSRFWGRYADKHSFAVMMEKCLLAFALSYICITFANPQTGKFAVSAYYVFHGIALGGINSAVINMIFDYVSPEFRADSLAICQAVAGIFGFLTTLLVSPLIMLVQTSGNSIFGITVYAQQMLSLGGMIITIIAVLFVRFMIIKGHRRS